MMRLHPKEKSASGTVQYLSSLSKRIFKNLLLTEFLDSKVQSKGLHIVSQRDKISVMDAANFAKNSVNLAAHANQSTRGS